MKAILEFDLPKEKNEFDLANEAFRWWYICKMTDNFLWHKLNNSSEELTPQDIAAYSDCKTFIAGLLDACNLDLTYDRS